MKTKIKNLKSLLDSQEFQAFLDGRLGNDLYINDPFRAERCFDAAENGGDGSTHAEVIEDWRAFLHTLKPIDSDYPEDGGDISDLDFARIEREIEVCEKWHEENGSLYAEVG